MRDTIRTFIAVKIIPEAELVTFLRRIKEEFSNDPIKWVDENNLHLTLRFLGETSYEQVQKINHSLEEIASQTERFSVKLKGTGYFKNKGVPRVLFIKMDEIVKLEILAGLIENEAQKAGFEPEERAFNPHLTLGRITFLKNREMFIQLANEWKEIEFQIVYVNEIIFYQSILSGKEPIYKPLGKFKLK